MASDNKIQIEIEINGERALATIGLTEENIKNLGASFNKAKRSTSDFSSTALAGMQDVRNAVQGLEGVWRTFNATFNRSFTAYERQINAEQRLESVLRASGREVEQNSARLREMAAAMQQATTFGDEQILEAQAVLLTFQNIGLETLPRVTEAALDMASVLGGDAVSSARQLAMALEDPERGLERLRRSGVTFTRELEEQIKQLAANGRQMEAQALILDELETRFKGTAKAIADTPAGRFRQLQNELGDLREEMGAIMASGIGPVVAGISSIIRTGNELSPMIGGAIGLAGTLTGAYVALNVTGLTPVIGKLITYGAAAKGTALGSTVAAGGVAILTGNFRAATIAAKMFFKSIGPIGWAILGFSALVPIIGMFSSRNREAAETTDQLDAALRNLTLDQKREKLAALANEIEVLSQAVRRAVDADWQKEQSEQLQQLRTQYQQLSESALMADREQLELEIAGQRAVLNRVESDLVEARGRLLRARNRADREESTTEVRALQERIMTLQTLINRYESQLNLLQERESKQKETVGLTPDQQRLLEQLRLDVIVDARKREFATLEQWYAKQTALAGDQQEILLLLEQVYTQRRAEITNVYQEREVAALRLFNDRKQAIEDDFRRLAGVAETKILEDRLERLQREYDAEQDSTDRKKQLYLDVLQASLELSREKNRREEEDLEEEERRVERRKQLLVDIARQELELFEASERLELARATQGLPYEERRMAELLLEQNLFLNRKNLLEQELQAVQENVDLTIEERQRQANAITLELLRIEQGLIDIDTAARELDDTFEWTTQNIVGYANQVLGAFGDLFRSLNQLYQQDARRKIEAETRKRNEALDTAEQEALSAATSAEESEAIMLVYEERRAALEEEALHKKAEAARKFFTLQQVASVGQATMSTYEAATRALTIPPPFGQTLAGILTAAGLTNVAVIASQEPPAFATGGLFRGAGGPTDDSNLVRLSDGEYIVNAASTSRYLPWLEEINTNRFNPAEPQFIPPPASPSDNGISRSLMKVGRDLSKLADRPVVAVAHISDFNTAAIVNRGTNRIKKLTYQP